LVQGFFSRQEIENDETTRRKRRQGRWQWVATFASPPVVQGEQRESSGLFKKQSDIDNDQAMVAEKEGGYTRKFLADLVMSLRSTKIITNI
jgi:hypothetical protein